MCLTRFLSLPSWVGEQAASCQSSNDGLFVRPAVATSADQPIRAAALSDLRSPSPPTPGGCQLRISTVAHAVHAQPYIKRDRGLLRKLEKLNSKLEGRKVEDSESEKSRSPSPKSRCVSRVAVGLVASSVASRSVASSGEKMTRNDAGHS